LAFRRHKINQADTSFGIREGGLEDEGALAISPVSDFGRRPRSYLPSAVLWLTEQRRKQLSESKRRKHSQSIGPFRATRAAASQSPIIP
jgi:hypothetical protein